MVEPKPSGVRPRALPSAVLLCSVLFFLPGVFADFTTHVGVGWCNSDLDVELWDGDLPVWYNGQQLSNPTASDCWTACQAAYGAAEPFHEFFNDGVESWCYCQDGCPCMADVGGSNTLAPADWVPPCTCGDCSPPPSQPSGGSMGWMSTLGDQESYCSMPGPASPPPPPVQPGQFGGFGGGGGGPPTYFCERDGATQAACTTPGAYWDSAAYLTLNSYRPCQEKWCEGSNVATYSQSDGDAVVNGMSSANWGQYYGPNGASDWYFWGEDFASVEDCQTAAEALSGSAIAEIWYVPPYPGCPAGSCIGYCFPSESRCTNGDTTPYGNGNKYYYNNI